MSARREVKVTVAGKGVLVASRCRLADTSLSRMVGLLNRDSLAEGEALLLDPCNHVHTLFMRFPIDVVFLAKDDTVVAVQELAPWRLSRLHLKSRKILELALGSCRRAGLVAGDRLEFSACSS